MSGLTPSNSAFTFVPNTSFDAEMQSNNQAINQPVNQSNNLVNLSSQLHSIHPAMNSSLGSSINQVVNHSINPVNPAINLRNQPDEEFPVFHLSVDPTTQSNIQSTPIQIDLTQPNSPRSFSALSTTNQTLTSSTNQSTNRLSRQSPPVSNTQSSPSITQTNNQPGAPTSAFVAYRRQRPSNERSNAELSDNQPSSFSSIFNVRPLRMFQPEDVELHLAPSSGQPVDLTSTDRQLFGRRPFAPPDLTRFRPSTLSGQSSISQSTSRAVEDPPALTDDNDFGSTFFPFPPNRSINQQSRNRRPESPLNFLNRPVNHPRSIAEQLVDDYPFVLRAPNQSAHSNSQSVASPAQIVVQAINQAISQPNSQSSSQSNNQTSNQSDYCGYDPSLFVEPAADSKELEELTCVICSCVVRQPLNLPCGDLFCRSCLTIAYNHSGTSGNRRCCPACKQSFVLSDCQPNYTVIKKIWGMKMACPHVADGCRSTFVIGVEDRNLTSHLAKCEHVNVNCPFCEDTLKKHQLVHHINDNMAQHMLKLQTKLKTANSSVESMQSVISRLQSKLNSQQTTFNQRHDALKEEMKKQHKKDKQTMNQSINQLIERRLKQFRQELVEQTNTQPAAINQSDMFLWKFHNVILAGSAPMTWSSSKFVLHGRSFVLMLNKCRNGSVMTLSLSLGDCGPVDQSNNQSSNEEKQNDSTSTSNHQSANSLIIREQSPLDLASSRVMQRMWTSGPTRDQSLSQSTRRYDDNERSARFSEEMSPSQSYLVQFYVFNTSSPSQSRSPLPVVVHSSQAALHVNNQSNNQSNNDSHDQDDEPMSEYLSLCSSEVVNAADSEGDGQAGWIDQLNSESVTAAVRISLIKQSLKLSNIDTVMTQHDYFIACDLHDQESKLNTINQSNKQSINRSDPSIFAPSSPLSGEGAAKRRRLEESTEMARR